MRSTAEGAQAERTALAWQRTALSFAVAAALMFRVNFSEHPPLMVIGDITALFLGLWVLFEIRRCYAHDVEDRLQRDRWDGRAGAVLAATMVLLALVECAAIVTP